MTRTKTHLRLGLAVFLAACGGAQAQPPEEEEAETVESAAVAPDTGGADVGLVRVRSAGGFVETVSQLEAALASRELQVMARVDHTANAQGAGLELRPTTLVVFGRPQAGTPMMVAAPTLGLDLPQRVLVYEEEGEVWIVYNDPVFLAQRHGLTGADELLGRIAGVLAGIAEEAGRAPAQ